MYKLYMNYKVNVMCVTGSPSIELSHWWKERGRKKYFIPGFFMKEYDHKKNCSLIEISSLNPQKVICTFVISKDYRFKLCLNNPCLCFPQPWLSSLTQRTSPHSTPFGKVPILWSWRSVFIKQMMERTSCPMTFLQNY